MNQTSPSKRLNGPPPLLLGHAADQAGHQLPIWPSSLRDSGGPNALGTLLPGHLNSGRRVWSGPLPLCETLLYADIDALIGNFSWVQTVATVPRYRPGLRLQEPFTFQQNTERFSPNRLLSAARPFLPTPVGFGAKRLSRTTQGAAAVASNGPL